MMTALAVTMVMLGATQKVEGRWKSAGAEDLGNGSFATREFVLTDKTWKLVFTIWGDRELKAPLVAIDFEGTFKQTGDSKTVPGASEATFEFSKKAVTLKADVAKSFGMDGCGLKVGEKKDVSKTGCSFVTPVASYGREFDLLERDGEQLFFGARPADGDMGSEAKRPKSLGAPLIRLK